MRRAQTKVTKIEDRLGGVMEDMLMVGFGAFLYFSSTLIYLFLTDNDCSAMMGV